MRLLSLLGVRQTIDPNLGISRSSNPNQVNLSLTDPTQWKELMEQWNGSSQASLKVAAFFACVDRISKDIASLPAGFMRRTDRGQEIAYDYDQAFLSDEPSPDYTAFTFQYLHNQVLCRFSETFAPIKRKNGRPVAYGFWHPSEVTLDERGGRKYWVNNRTKDVVNDDDMLHPMWFTMDGKRGYPITKLMQDTLNMGVNGKKMASKLYENMGFGSGYLSLAGDFDEHQADLISKNWSNTSKTDKVNFLDNGGKWLPYGGTLKDSDVATLMNFTDEQIARFMGVHPSKIGIRNANVSYNSLEQENIGYVQDSLQPRISSWEQEINRKVIGEADKGSIFFKYELKGRLRGDTTTRTAFYLAMLNGGVFTPNDILNLEDMHTGGPECDERYMNAASVTLKSIFEGKTLQKATQTSPDTAKLFEDYVKSLKPNGNGATHHEVLQH